MDKFTQRVAKLINLLIIVGTSIMVSMVCLEVVLRYVFGHTLYITEEATRYIMVWIVFLGTAIAFHENSHIAIDALTSRLKKFKVLFELFSNVVVTFFCLFLIIEGIRILPMQLDQESITLGVSVFWFYLAIPVGAVISLIFLLPKIYGGFAGLKKTAFGKGEQDV
ncbi:C4-dicarboxylate ABC transporter permease [Deltaproteobacteria bacterium]|nr:C4-dicarboxylate ABC transporter permease [Deltaproteobacteria bacterium]